MLYQQPLTIVHHLNNEPILTNQIHILFHVIYPSVLAFQILTYSSLATVANVNSVIGLKDKHSTAFRWASTIVLGQLLKQEDISKSLLIYLYVNIPL